MIRDLIKAYLPHLIGLALLILAGLAAWQWVTGLGYRVQAAALETKVERLQGDLTACQGTAASRLMQIEAQNAALQKAQNDAERRRKAALAARDEALGALEATQARYDRLRDNWPQGCVEAVQRVREEYGL